MIFPNTILKVVDNSGARYAKCLQTLGDSLKKYMKTADLIKVSIKETKLTKIRRKRLISDKLHWGLVLTTRRRFKRKNGHCLKFESNRVILFNLNWVFLGTRVYGAAAKEVRKHKKFSKNFLLIKNFY